MARIVLFPAAVSQVLAHVGSCIAVGRELQRRGHDVVLAYGGAMPAVAESSGLRVEPAFEVELRHGDPRFLARYFRSVEDLDLIVRADVDLLRRVRPDVALVDARVAGRIACEIAGVPVTEIMHFLSAHPWYREPGAWARRLRWVTRPQRLPGYLRRRFHPDPVGAKQMRRIFDATRERHSLPPAGLVGAQRVACPTTPLFHPTEGMPEHWRYVGPISWSAPAEGELPPTSSRPLVYVTQGSTGSPDILSRVVRELASEPCDVLVTTSQLCEPSALMALAPNVTAARLLPSRDCMERASVAVIHGGSVTAFDAHSAGTPVVVLPHDYDQWAWADQAERLRTGIAVRPPYLPGQIRRAVRRVLRRDRYRVAVNAVAQHLREWDGARGTADLLEELL